MKKIILVFSIVIYAYLVSSCSVDEVEPFQVQKPVKVDYSDAMMQRDSIAKDGDVIDPPYKPVIVGTRP